MTANFILSAILLFAIQPINAQAAKSLSKYNHFLKPPSSTIHTGGRLTEREIAYMAQAGYASYLSIVEFGTNDTSFNGVNGAFPSTQYEMELTKKYGMDGKYVISSLTEDSLTAISKIIDGAKKPLYIHCHVGYTATLFTELYFYTKKLISSSSELYKNGLDYGYDYQSNANAVAFVNSVTGANDKVQPESIEQTLADGESSYKSYYWVHRAGQSDYWYNVGQILDTHVSAIKTAGYRSVISFRDDGEATTRLPTDPRVGSVENGEFSDSKGNYRVADEKAAVESAGMRFFHLPLNGGAAATWTVEQYQKYAPIMVEAEALGPVLSHCASGYRSAAYVMAYLGTMGGHCADWAVRESSFVGLEFGADKQVLDFFHQVLKC